MSYWDKESFYGEDSLATKLKNEAEVLRKKDQIARGDERAKPTGPKDQAIYERGLGTLQTRAEEARQAYLKLKQEADYIEGQARNDGAFVGLGKMSNAIGELRSAAVTHKEQYNQLLVEATNAEVEKTFEGINPKDVLGQKKAPLHLVPPALRIYVSQAMADGAAKYGPYNWRDKPIMSSVYYSACARHLDAWWDGEEKAEDSGVHHLAHAAACLALLIDAIECEVLKDDRPIKGAAADLMKRLAEDKAAANEALDEDWDAPVGGLRVEDNKYEDNKYMDAYGDCDCAFCCDDDYDEDAYEEEMDELDQEPTGVLQIVEPTEEERGRYFDCPAGCGECGSNEDS